MKLTWNGIKEKKEWENAGITLPGYDVQAAAEKEREKPRWAHFGIGNIFRIFIGTCPAIRKEQLLHFGDGVFRHKIQRKLYLLSFLQGNHRKTAHLKDRHPGDPVVRPLKLSLLAADLLPVHK